MTKSEIIAKYGEEAYKKSLEASRNKYNNNKKRLSEYSRKWKESNRENNLQKYCSESLNQIENYEQAKFENFKGWCIHHRLELHPDFSVRFTVSSLKKLNLYYNRPARELIFLQHSEHACIHNKGRSAEGQLAIPFEKMREAWIKSFLTKKRETTYFENCD